MIGQGARPVIGARVPPGIGARVPPGIGARLFPGTTGPPEPTPWATGLTVTAFVTAFVLLLDVLLTRTLAAAFGWVWIPANLVFGVGLAPSVWLMRVMPFWRWIGYGVALGLLLCWAGLVVTSAVGDPP
ncbi:MAG TPA: DUF2537 domain-containing protein [Pseudonocardia sp.]